MKGTGLVFKTELLKAPSHKPITEITGLNHSAQIQGFGRCRKNRFLCTIILINSLIFYPSWFLSPQSAEMPVLED